MNSNEILEREFLAMRAKILELAASMDRIDRAAGDVSDTQSLTLIRRGLDVLIADQPNRAEQVQMLFSRQYQKNWQNEFQLQPRF